LIGNFTTHAARFHRDFYAASAEARPGIQFRSRWEFPSLRFSSREFVTLFYV